MLSHRNQVALLSIYPFRLSSYSLQICLGGSEQIQHRLGESFIQRLVA
jgi:hypothetical protein